MEIDVLSDRQNSAAASSLQGHVENLDKAFEAQGADLDFIAEEITRGSEMYARLHDRGAWDAPLTFTRRVAEKMTLNELPGHKPGEAAVLLNALMAEQFSYTADRIYSGDDDSLVDRLRQIVATDSKAARTLKSLEDAFQAAPNVDFEQDDADNLAKIRLNSDVENNRLAFEYDDERDVLSITHSAFGVFDDEYDSDELFDRDELPFDPEEQFSARTLIENMAHKLEIVARTEADRARRRLENQMETLLDL